MRCSEPGVSVAVGVSLDAFILRVASNKADETDFTLLGSYVTQDAQKLLERLDRSGIAFRDTPTRWIFRLFPQK